MIDKTRLAPIVNNSIDLSTDSNDEGG
jgi:hypothetical protein